jgi:hypothetical protein
MLDAYLERHNRSVALKRALEFRYSARNPVTKTVGKMVVSYCERQVDILDSQLDRRARRESGRLSPPLHADPVHFHIASVEATMAGHDPDQLAADIPEQLPDEQISTAATSSQDQA